MIKLYSSEGDELRDQRAPTDRDYPVPGPSLASRERRVMVTPPGEASISVIYRTELKTPTHRVRPAEKMLIITTLV